MKISFTGSLIILALTTCFAPVSITHAQKDSSNYSVDDWLNLKTVSADDLSNDGKWLVLTSSIFRDRLGNNNYRLGDPTYVFQPPIDVSAMNTQTGEMRRVGDGKIRMRSSEWSPDASRLAMFISSTGWLLTGNAGTVDGTNFIGTTDNVNLNTGIEVHASAIQTI
jgi:hypothetical protein